jgi:DNA polymerase-3 subunit gamma/tau
MVSESKDTGRGGFQVLARRYRPQTFAEVVGQDTIVRTLTNTIRAERIAHAYLFHGTRGVGKTTMARLLAKALNCEQGPTAEPCNTCSSCTEITAGGAVDVLEIDGASHNRVDDVRDLQESLTYQPVRDRYRVIIIDEVHMLSRSAFNALLKTLEEPPSHVVFVLATTELEKIPATILSRCQHFTFRRIRRGDLLKHLENIAGKEELSLTSRSLTMVARQASGSVRDALSALDQVVSFCGKDADEEDVEAVLGALPATRVDELLQHIAEANAAGALTALRSSEDRGDDPVRFAEALVGRLRDLSVLAAVGQDAGLVEAGEEELLELDAMASRLGEDALLRLFQIAVNLGPALRHSRHPRILLELTALKMLKAADLTTLAELAATLSETPVPAAGGGNTPSRSRPATAPGRSAAPPAPRAEVRRSAPTPASRKAAAPAPPAAPSETTRPASSAPAQDLDMNRLRTVVEKLRPAVAAFLEHSEGSLTGNTLNLMFQPRHSFFKKSVEMAANFDALKQAVAETLGAGVEINLGLAERDQPPPQPMPEKEADQRKRLMEEASGQPAVRSLRNVFGAEIVRIQPANSTPDPNPRETDS